MSSNKSAGLKRSGEMLVTGWKMLALVCPVCAFPLMEKAGSMMCPGCNVPVVRESSLPNRFENATEERDDQVEAEEDDEEEDEEEEVEQDNVPTSLPAGSRTYEEMRRDYEAKSNQQRAVSAKLGQKMLQGWTLLGSSCPRDSCRGTPLMNSPADRRNMECVSCNLIYCFDSNGELQQVQTTSDVPIPKVPSEQDASPKASSATASKVDPSASFRTQSLPLLSSKKDDMDPSAKLSAKLLAGWAMLAQACSEPGCDGAVPLMRDLAGQVVCVCCSAVCLSENIDKKVSSSVEEEGRDGEKEDDNDDDEEEGDAEFQRILQQMRETRMREVLVRQKTSSRTGRDEDSRPTTASTDSVTGTTATGVRGILDTFHDATEKSNPIASVIIQKLRRVVRELEQETDVEVMGRLAELIPKLVAAYHALSSIRDTNIMNPEQQSAVCADLNRPLCIVAGPGSGKTFTLIERTKHISRADPHARMLVLAFSKAAVVEMQSRLATDGCNLQQVAVMTFHSFGYKTILGLHRHMGFERPPAKCSFKQSMDALKESLDSAPDLLLAYHASENQSAFLRRLLKLIHFAKCKPNPAAHLAQHASSDLNESRQIVRVFQAYQQYLKKRALVDFPDMVSLPSQLFDQFAAPSNQGQPTGGTIGSDVVLWALQQYKYVVVDEFQDLNGVQLRLLLHLASHGRVTVVGDFDQMIYSFQGADRANFQRFRQFFEQRSCAVALQQLRLNYRSIGPIVEASNLVANQRTADSGGASGSLMQKNMVSAVDLMSGGRLSETESVIDIVECPQDRETLFNYLGSHINRRLQEQRYSDKPNSIAVLYRQNATGKELKKFLKSKFPQIRTKQHKLDAEDIGEGDLGNQFEHVTRLVMAWLKMAVDLADDASCAVCLENFERSLGSSRGAKRRQSSEGGPSVVQRATDLRAEGRVSSLFAAARTVVSPEEQCTSPKLTGKKRKSAAENSNFQAIASKMDKIESLHDRVASNEETLPRILEKALDDMGLLKKERTQQARKQALQRQQQQELQFRQSFATVHSSSHTTATSSSVATVTATNDSDDELGDDKARVLEYFTALKMEADRLQRDAQFRALSNKQQLHTFLRLVTESDQPALTGGTASKSATGETGDDCVWLGTVHSAKGREWAHVYLVDADDSTYSDFRRNQAQDLVESDSDADGDLEVETGDEAASACTRTDDSKNLVYVAVSRAKLSLTLLYQSTGSSSSGQSCQLSRYLKPVAALVGQGAVKFERVGKIPQAMGQSSTYQSSSNINTQCKSIYSSKDENTPSQISASTSVNVTETKGNPLAQGFQRASTLVMPVKNPVKTVAPTKPLSFKSAYQPEPRSSGGYTLPAPSAHPDIVASGSVGTASYSTQPVKTSDDKENAVGCQRPDTPKTLPAAKPRFPPSAMLLANLKAPVLAQRNVSVQPQAAPKRVQSGEIIDLT